MFLSTMFIVCEVLLYSCISCLETTENGWARYQNALQLHKLFRKPDVGCNALCITSRLHKPFRKHSFAFNSIVFPSRLHKLFRKKSYVSAVRQSALRLNKGVRIFLKYLKLFAFILKRGYFLKVLDNFFLLSKVVAFWFAGFGRYLLADIFISVSASELGGFCAKSP